MKTAIITENAQEGHQLALLLDQFGREFHVPLETEILNRSAWNTCNAEYALSFLDGDLEGCLEIGVQLRTTTRSGGIILFTGQNRAALLGYAIHPDGFLPKPISYFALRIAMERCRSCWYQEAKAIELIVNRVKVRILDGDIEYLETQGRLLTLHGRYGQVESRTPLIQMEKELSNTSFMTCQRGFLVNLFCVRSVNSDSLILESGACLPISTDNRETFAAIWKQFCKENSFWAKMTLNEAENS